MVDVPVTCGSQRLQGQGLLAIFVAAWLTVSHWSAFEFSFVIFGAFGSQRMMILQFVFDIQIS